MFQPFKANPKEWLRLWIAFNLGVLVLCIGYAATYRLAEQFGWRLFDCTFKNLLHLYCPGCGGSRSLLALLRLDFVSAFRFCPFLPVTAGLFLVNDGWMLTAVVKQNPQMISRFPWKIWWSVPVMMLLQFVVRNLFLLAGVDFIGDILG